VGELGDMSLERFLELTGLSLRELKEASRKLSVSKNLGMPICHDTDLLGYVLQRTQQSIYRPDEVQTGFDCMELHGESEDIWFALCEAEFHAN